MTSTKAAVAAIALALAAPAAQAASMSYSLDVANSNVTLTDQTGGGYICYFTHCGINASKSSSLGALGTFDVEEGESKSFDFIDFTFDGSTLTGRSFDIVAELAFSDPDVAHSSTGSGKAVFIGGTIGFNAGAGYLKWDDPEEQFTLADGSMFTVGFEDGFTFFLGEPVSVKASVTTDYVAPAPVPLPASALLLVAGLGGLAAARRRKAAA